jgi:di/tricarboxylate transporter
MLLAVVALFLFSRDRIPMETSALVVLGILVVGFQVFPYVSPDGRTLDTGDFLAGFGNSALITIMALLICTRGLEATGALQPVADRLARIWLRSPMLALLVALVLAAGLSMFLNNTPVVAMLLPILVSVAMRTGRPASSVLMPVGYATIIGGMCTTIGTSTNLLVVEVSTQMGLEPMGIFHFTGIALSAAVAGHRLPLAGCAAARAAAHAADAGHLAARFRGDLAHRRGQRHRGAHGARADRTDRGQDAASAPSSAAPACYVARLPSVAIRAGDRLHVRDTPEQLKRFEASSARPCTTRGDPTGRPAPRASDRRTRDQRMAEIVVTRGSPLHRRTLNTVPFFAHHGLLPVAVHRPRSPGADVTDIGDVFLRAGDIVLVQGSAASLDGIKRLGNVLVVDGSIDLPHTSKAPVAATIVVAVVLCAAFGVLPIGVAALVGVLAMVISGCLNWRSALGALDRRLIIVIVTSLGARPRA